MAAYILLPVVILFGIELMERIHCTRLESDIARRRLQLRIIPDMESRLQRARERLKSFAEVQDGSDGSSDLTMRLNSGAQESGFLTRAVKLEKMPSAGGTGWTDYKVVASGEGSLLALTRFLDDAERIGTRPFRVTQARIAARSLSPEVTYDAEIELMLRTLQCETTIKPGGGAAALPMDEGEIARAEARIDALLESVQKRQREQAGLLPLARIKSRTSAYSSGQLPDMPFQLTGVVRDSKTPLILTDQGVMGVGDERGGFRIVEIKEDSVVVDRPKGGRMVLKMYSADESQ